ncbi:MAG: hypothetical protein ACK41P_10360 [Asticcacaulis sp.]
MANTPETHESTEAAGHHAQGGLPQLQFEYWAGQIVWLLIIFTIVYLLIARMFAPRMRKAIDDRGQTIAEDLASARAMRDEAEAQRAEANLEKAKAKTEAKKLAAEAKAKAAAETAKRQAAEEASLNAKLAEADARIRSARDQAMTHVRAIAEETANSVIEKLTGDTTKGADIKAALEKA